MLGLEIQWAICTESYLERAWRSGDIYVTPHPLLWPFDSSRIHRVTVLPRGLVFFFVSCLVMNQINLASSENSKTNRYRNESGNGTIVF